MRSGVFIAAPRARRVDTIRPEGRAQRSLHGRPLQCRREIDGFIGIVRIHLVDVAEQRGGHLRIGDTDDGGESREGASETSSVEAVRHRERAHEVRARSITITGKRRDQTEAVERGCQRLLHADALRRLDHRFERCAREVDLSLAEVDRAEVRSHHHERFTSPSSVNSTTTASNPSRDAAPSVLETRQLIRDDLTGSFDPATDLIHAVVPSDALAGWDPLLPVLGEGTRLGSLTVEAGRAFGAHPIGPVFHIPDRANGLCAYVVGSD